MEFSYYEEMTRLYICIPEGYHINEVAIMQILLAEHSAANEHSLTLQPD